MIPRLADIWDEPFADVSQIPTYLVSRVARQDVTVSLSGDAGDELFAGYNRHAWLDRVWGRAALVPAGARRTVRLRSGQRSACGRRAGRPRPRAVLPAGWQLRNPSTKVAKLARVLSAVGCRGRLSGSDDSLGRCAVAGDSGTTGETRQTIADPSPFSDGGITEHMLWSDLVGYLPDDILTKLDRAAMAASLETRVPFLDRSDPRVWPGGCRSMPSSAEVRPSGCCARCSSAMCRQRSSSDRRWDSALPIGWWLRGALAPWVEHLLDERRLRDQGLLDPVPDSPGLGSPPHGSTGPGLRAMGRAGPAVLDGSVDAVHPARGPLRARRLDRPRDKNCANVVNYIVTSSDRRARVVPSRTMAARGRDPADLCSRRLDEPKGPEQVAGIVVSTRQVSRLRTHPAASWQCLPPRSVRHRRVFYGCCPGAPVIASSRNENANVAVAHSACKGGSISTATRGKRYSPPALRPIPRRLR